MTDTEPTGEDRPVIDGGPVTEEILEPVDVDLGLGSDWTTTVRATRRSSDSGLTVTITVKISSPDGTTESLSVAPPFVLFTPPEATP